MSALEHELIERISRLDAEKQRDRLVIESLRRSTNEDFDLFEAYSEEDLDDSY